MRMIEPSFKWLGNAPDGGQILKNIGTAGRVCYQSENRDAATFVRGIIKRGHESVLEHEKISVLLTTDRGVTHELVRHRIASYSQESTRYVKYEDLEVIKPIWYDDALADVKNVFRFSMVDAEEYYQNLLACGLKAQDARAVLPNAVKTQIAVTMNLREWRHFFKLRCDKAAHPEMRRVAKMLLLAFADAVPVVFDDLRNEFLEG